MCDITMGLGLALSAVSAIAQQRAAAEAASQQAAYQEAQMKAHNEAIKQSAQNALKEQVEQTTAERMQQMQEAQASAREQQKHQTEYLQKKGTAMASSPYGAGLSFDMLMDDYGRAYAVAPQGGRFNVVACLCGRGRKYPGSLAGHRQLFAWRAHALRSATSTAL